MTKEEAIAYTKKVATQSLLEMAKKGGEGESYDWTFLCTYFAMPEFFMEEYASELDWEAVSIYQPMAKSFMRNFKEDIVWKEATLTQHMDEEFIDEMKNFIDFDVLFYSKILSPEFLQKHINKFENWITNCHEDSKTEYSISKQEDWFKSAEGAKLKNILFVNLRTVGALCLHEEDYENDVSMGNVDDIITSANKVMEEESTKNDQ